MAQDPLDAALRAAISPRRDRPLGPLLAACDPDALWARATEHGVDLALANAVRATRDVDARLLVRARDTVVVARARTEAQLRELADAERALVAAGVATLWLRGPALAVAAWGDAFARRPGRDLDLLVRPGDRLRAQALAPGIDVADAAPGLTASFDALLARARTVDVGVPIRTLSDADHAKVLRARAARRRRVRYGDWLDVARLIGAEAGEPPAPGGWLRGSFRRLRCRWDNR